MDPYRIISINNLELKVNGAIPGEAVNLRIYPMSNGISEIRFWCNNKLIDVRRIKNSELGIVHF